MIDTDKSTLQDTHPLKAPQPILFPRSHATTTDQEESFREFYAQMSEEELEIRMRACVKIQRKYRLLHRAGKINFKSMNEFEMWFSAMDAAQIKAEMIKEYNVKNPLKVGGKQPSGFREI